MAGEVVSQSELLEMVEEGALVRRNKGPTVIDRFDELIAQLKALVDSQKELAAADLARSKSQLEVLATLQATIKRQNVTKLHSAPDLKPLMSVLSEIQEANAHRPHMGYEFQIHRDGRGYSDRIVATPIPPTRH